MRFAERIVALPYRRFCGRMIQGYEIGKIVGIGGSGVVFDAFSPDGEPVVLKLLRPLRTSVDLEAVWREVGPLAALDHPAVPTWLGIVRQRKAYFVALSCAPGQSLSHWLFVQRHQFSSEEILKVGQLLADVLAYLHEQGIAHGDLRPANIMYDGNCITLVDFGMSVQQAHCGYDIRLTQENKPGFFSQSTFDNKKNFRKGDIPLDLATESAFTQTCAEDLAGFADIVIYLLYSSFDVNTHLQAAKTADWQDELLLSVAQRTLLQEALAAPGGDSFDCSNTQRSTAKPLNATNLLSRFQAAFESMRDFRKPTRML